MRERGYWDQYMNAYEEMVQNTATEEAPWYVVPADNKWYTRTIVAAAIIDALGTLDLRYPEVSEAQRHEIAAAKAALLES
jgi:polyphosphate kinase 2 (PPK2 family)